MCSKLCCFGLTGQRRRLAATADVASPYRKAQPTYRQGTVPCITVRKVQRLHLVHVTLRDLVPAQKMVSKSSCRGPVLGKGRGNIREALEDCVDPPLRQQKILPYRPVAIRCLFAVQLMRDFGTKIYRHPCRCSTKFLLPHSRVLALLLLQTGLHEKHGPGAGSVLHSWASPHPKVSKPPNALQPRGHLQRTSAGNVHTALPSEHRDFGPRRTSHHQSSI